jgi:ubiquinone/menaquinone biosynthesis C-methylase UbiE
MDSATARLAVESCRLWVLCLRVAGESAGNVVSMDSTNADVQRVFDKIAGRYDRQMAFWERRLFRGSRQWAVGQARGRVVEIAVGTGLNLPLYPAEVTVIGIELSEPMLGLARERAAEAGLTDRTELRQGDAQALDLPDVCADTVVSTFSLCTIPDPAAAVREAYRILRPGGQILLAEHGPSSNTVIRAGMRAAEPLTVRFGADHLTRDPRLLLEQAGFHIDTTERRTVGVSFRVRATRQDGPQGVSERKLAIAGRPRFQFGDGTVLPIQRAVRSLACRLSTCLLSKRPVTAGSSLSRPRVSWSSSSAWTRRRWSSRGPGAVRQRAWAGLCSGALCGCSAPSRRRSGLGPGLRGGVRGRAAWRGR